jgi:RNA polymerase sigma-70 factor (ECF subfamily)
MAHSNPTSKQHPASFATTHWSLVAAVGSRDSSQGRAALETLCSRYWYPLYAWLRSSGSCHEDAQDLVQAFLTETIEMGRMEQADPARGRFRSFLLASLKNFRANRWRENSVQKRGGGLANLSLDFASAQSSWANEPAHEETADRIFDRKWALQLIDEAMQDLARTCHERGRGELFELIKPFLSGYSDESSYQKIAEQVGMTANAVKVAVHRWREQLGQAIRREIRETVLFESEVDQELEYLFEILSG